MPSQQTNSKPVEKKHPRALLSHDREANLFWRLRRRLFITQTKQTLENSRLRTALVIGLSLLFWLGLFALFYAGFDFLVVHVGKSGAAYHAQTIQLVFHLFFASLNVMLVMSAGIIFYSGIYRSEDSRQLLTMPVRQERIVLYKFQEAVFFSSWGFFLLGSPMMIAYGMVVEAPWHYFLLLIPFMISFIYIPCGLGAIACLLLVRLLPRFRKIVVAVLGVVLFGIAFKLLWSTFGTIDDGIFQQEWFEQTFDRFRILRTQILPSTWLTAGVMEAARQNREWFGTKPVYESLKYMGLLATNAMMVHVVLVWLGGKILRTSYCTLVSRGNRVGKRGVSLVDKLGEQLLFWLPQQTRLLLIKDFRVFRRDPVQWSQFLIFFVLLGLYFLNMDRFSGSQRDISHKAWVNMVSFMNLAVVGLILSTFTTRFIYPMISLEGKRFWILGLLPLPRDTIVWSKFIFAAGGAWLPCAILVLSSDMLLRAPFVVILMHQITCVMLSIGLAAIAVGLGATMPNMQEDSPSKIAAGFGGTLNLVLSALFILLVTVLTALPAHFYTMSQVIGLQIAWVANYSWDKWLIVGLIASCCVTGVATFFPLRSGLRTFRETEF